MIPLLDRVTHSMSYKPAEGQDGLRIIIDRANSQVRIRKEGRTILASSVTTNGGQE